ncbi:MAG: 6-bladed beta-propeller, partial [Ignavibacteria bacterium]|nr:6-bladed beta-propeller [Ignavibacteria bacterium]
MRRIGLVLFFLLIFKCSNESEPYNHRLIKSLDRYSDSSYVSNQISDIVFYKNHFYISETSNNRIVSLNNRFEVVKTYGNQGYGPSEFIRLSYFNIIHDTLYILDETGRKIKVFDMNGIFIRYFNSPSTIYNRKFAVDKNLFFYFSTPSDNYNITKTDLNGNIVSMFGEQIERYGKKQKIFNNIKDLFINDNQELIAISNTTPIIEKYNIDGRLIKRIDLTILPNIYKFDMYIESMV